MFKNLMQLYAIAICFLSAIALMIMLCSTGDNILCIIFPKYMNKITLSSFDSNETYLQRESVKENKQNYERLIKLPPDELTKERLQERKRYMENTKTIALQSLIKYMYSILITLAFFVIHWRLYKKNSYELNGILS